MRFSYGNTYERLKDADSAFPQSKLTLEHSWAMFVILTEDKTKTEGYIKSVTYSLPQICEKTGKPLYD